MAKLLTYLARHGHLDAANWKRLYWQQYVDVRLEGLVRAFEGHIMVDIGSTSHWVGLSQTAYHLGGFRHWFICPQCNKRMGVLYMRHGHFACRNCQQISYQSQSGDAEDRMIWKYHSLQQAMGNLKLKSSRSRVRIFNNFLKVAWQYDAMLDTAVSRIEIADATRC